MKAISLHQPWASLVAAGHKAHETRSRLFGVEGEPGNGEKTSVIRGAGLDESQGY
jgi:hypothetical protein